MPFQINRPLIGAPDLIGGKTWTTNPALVDDQLRLTYDAREDFLAGRAIAQFYAGFSITGVSSYYGLTVPSDEAWWAYRFSFQSSQLAATNILQIEKDHFSVV